MKRSPRRTIVKVLLLLAAGAALNVAVAWGLALWSRLGVGELIEPVPSAYVAWYRSNSPLRVGWQEGWLRQRRGVGLTIQWSYNWIPKAGPARSGYSLESYRTVTGLPFHCLDGAIWQSPADNSQPFGLTLPRQVGPFQVLTMHYGGVLPLRPLWPGFAINTVFYAGVLWVLFCGPFALRRMIRRRRGQCAQCAYPIGQNERCTECGAALK